MIGSGQAGGGSGLRKTKAFYSIDTMGRESAEREVGYCICCVRGVV